VEHKFRQGAVKERSFDVKVEVFIGKDVFFKAKCMASWRKVRAALGIQKNDASPTAHQLLAHRQFMGALSLFDRQFIMNFKSKS
jgi:hypothetical protein